MLSVSIPNCLLQSKCYCSKLLNIQLDILIKILRFRSESTANVQTTEIIYAADDAQTTETRTIGVC